MEKTIAFLKRLKMNNDKEWFDSNKNQYLEAKDEFEKLVDNLIQGTNKFDKKISSDLKAKNCTFRIYKDVRFSKDKSPYKTNFGASINPGGKKALFVGYYLHVEPGNSFLAGGVYMPEPPVLQAIRQEIDYNVEPLLKVFKSASFKKYFKGFDEDDKLKTAPKGFEKDHPHIEILKNKHFVVSCKLSDKEMLDKNFERQVLSGFKAMQPLLEYLREATTN